MEFSTEQRDTALVLTVKGRMDAVTAPEFENECQTHIDAGTTTIVADMSGLEFISSAGLRAILSSAKRLKAAGGKMVFCNLSGMVQEVFQVSGFSSMFPVTGSVDEAMEKV